MPELTFNVGGQVLTEHQMQALKSSAKPKPKAKANKPDSYHNGWAVEGYPPGFFDRAQKHALTERAEWDSLAPDDQASMLRNGKKPPKEWSEARFLATTKRKRVRRPYEVASAAETCLKLAEREGWTHLEVVELKAGEKPAGLF